MDLSGYNFTPATQAWHVSGTVHTGEGERRDTWPVLGWFAGGNLVMAAVVEDGNVVPVTNDLIAYPYWQAGYTLAPGSGWSRGGPLRKGDVALDPGKPETMFTDEQYQNLQQTLGEQVRIPKEMLGDAERETVSAARVPAEPWDARYASFMDSEDLWALTERKDIAVAVPVKPAEVSDRPVDEVVPCPSDILRYRGRRIAPAPWAETPYVYFWGMAEDQEGRRIYGEVHRHYLPAEEYEGASFPCWRLPIDWTWATRSKWEIGKIPERMDYR